MRDKRCTCLEKWEANQIGLHLQSFCLVHCSQRSDGMDGLGPTGKVTKGFRTGYKISMPLLQFIA